MTSTTPPPTPAPTGSRLHLPSLDAVAISYAQAVVDLPDDAGRQARRDRLVRGALPFASRLARRYRGRGEALEDLEQVAREGLLKAVDRYDPARGSFTGFAARTITGELRRHFRDRTWGVHVPRRLQELSLEVSRASTELTSELRRAPTVADLARYLDTSEEEILAALETATAYAPISLNAPARPETGAELVDLLGDADTDFESVDDRVTVAALLCRLPDRERRILALRFYGNKTQSEIAAELDLSQMHVSRLLSRALTWLREAMLSDVPQQWQPGSILPDSHDLTIHHRLDGGAVRLDVTGEVDRDTAAQLRDALLAAMRRPTVEVRVDLAGVPFIDAGGIAALLVGFEAARGVGIRMRIGGAQPYVRTALRAAGLHPLPDQPPRPPAPSARAPRSARRLP